MLNFNSVLLPGESELKIDLEEKGFVDLTTHVECDKRKPNSVF